MRLLRHGVLVREDGALAAFQGMDIQAVATAGWRLEGRVAGQEFGEAARVGGVDGGDDREVVLEFVEVLLRRGEGVVERVGEGGIEGAERELVDLVGEVEG